MGEWDSPVERLIREAIEAGAFDDLPGKGRPIELESSPFEDRMAGTLRRILRDNGASHPVVEARRAIEDELQAARAEWGRTRNEPAFRARIREINREIKLFNLSSPIPQFHLSVIQADSEINKPT